MKKALLIPKRRLSPTLEYLIRKGVEIAERKSGVSFAYVGTPSLGYFAHAFYRLSAPIVRRRFGIVHPIYPFRTARELREWGLIRSQEEYKLSRVFGIVGRSGAGIAVGENATSELIAHTSIHETGHEAGIRDCLSLPRGKGWGRIESGELVCVVKGGLSSEEIEEILDDHPGAVIATNSLMGKRIEYRALFPEDVASLCIMTHPFQSLHVHPAEWSEEVKEEWRRAVGEQKLCEKCYSHLRSFF